MAVIRTAAFAAASHTTFTENSYMAKALRLVVALFLFMFSSLAVAQTTVDAGANGWSVSGLGDPVAYYKDASGTVHLQGMAWRFYTNCSDPPICTSHANEAAFTLPVGYRPAVDSWFLAIHQQGIARVLVYANGDVQIAADFAYFTWVSFVGLTFLAP
jgi:hypothetical protein